MTDDIRIKENYFGASSPLSSHSLDTPERQDRTGDRKAAILSSSQLSGLTNYKAMLDALESAQGDLDSKYQFNTSKYDEKRSRANITRLENDLVQAGVPKWVVQHGLAQAEKRLGQKGIRSWRHWHHQKAVNKAVIETGIGRMRALLEPAVKAQSRIEHVEAEIEELRSALEETKAKLVEPKVRLTALADSQTKYGAQAYKELSEQARELEEDAAAYEQLIAVNEQELATLRKVVASAASDPDPRNHQDRVQSQLKVIGSDQAFQAAYDRTNPGDLRKGIGGGLRRMQLWKASKAYLKSLATLSISSWVQAIRSQDKARMLAFAQEQMPTPTARVMAGAMMDAFDADAYAQGMNASITTVSLPVTLYGFASGAGVAGALVPAHLSAGIHAAGSEITHGLSHTTAGTGGNIDWGNWGHEVATSKTNAGIQDPRKLRQSESSVQMPTIAVKMRSGAIKDVNLADKHTATALLIYLGPRVDQAKIVNGDAGEIARRNLRRELFRADDEEHLELSDETGKVQTDTAGDEENARLMEALFYEDTPDRETILARTTPMKKLFAAAGLLTTPSFKARF